MRESYIKIKNIEGLYVHIPFCEHICFYCDFVKIKKPLDSKIIDKYLDNIEKELQDYKNRLDNLKSIYIGGGTPSCLDVPHTVRLLKILSKYVKKENFEYSIELNPESVTQEKLQIYKHYKINRLSMGVQTFDNKLLKKIGRVHNNKIVLKAYKLIKKSNFVNISIDLMYNLFDQNKANIKKDLYYIKKLKPDHISWYSLIMKENSIWGKNNKRLPENDELFDKLINKKLKQLKYIRYEVSNYARNIQAKSVHNIGYWTNALFVGVGLGASGFEYDSKGYYLTENKGNVLDYKKQITRLSMSDYYFQILMMGLRMIEGIDLLKTENKNMYLFFEKKIKQKIIQNLLILHDNKLKCTERSINILNEILIDFL